MSAPASRWAELLAIALPALDHVFGPGDQSILNILADEASDALPRTMQSLDFIGPQDVRHTVLPTPAYAGLLDTALEQAKLAIRSAIDIAEGRRPRVAEAG